MPSNDTVVTIAAKQSSNLAGVVIVIDCKTGFESRIESITDRALMSLLNE